jgi:hypothetical protein
MIYDEKPEDSKAVRAATDRAPYVFEDLTPIRALLEVRPANGAGA